MVKKVGIKKKSNAKPRDSWFGIGGLKEYDFAINPKGKTITRYWSSGRAGYGKSKKTISKNKEF